MLAAKLLGASGTAAKTYVDDVFSAYTYTGNGSTQTITNGIDLSGKGGLVWTKNRSNASSNSLVDTTRGVHKYLQTNSTAAEGTSSATVTAFSSTGFSIGSDGWHNASSQTYVSWTFRKAEKFFDVVTWTGDGAAGGRTIAHSLASSVGCIITKRTNDTAGWAVWHRGTTSGNYLVLNDTAAQTTSAAVNRFGNDTITVDPTSASFTVGSVLNTSAITYVAYLFAHDTSTDGLIQCGSFTTDGSGGGSVTLGWEPQFLMMKNKGGVGVPAWAMYDTTRSLNASTATNTPALLAYSSAAEASPSGVINPTATGFVVAGLSASATIIYLAIRRPNKPPTTGTQVYNAIARTGTGAAATVTGVGFAPDLVLSKQRANVSGTNTTDRLRGRTFALITSGTNAEQGPSPTTNDLTSFGMDGVSFGSPNFTAYNTNTQTEINHFFKRAPGVMDVVCYTGTGSATTVSHGLGVAPELMIVKARNDSTRKNWVVYAAPQGNTKSAWLESTISFSVTGYNEWNNTSPTSSVFSVGTEPAVNQNEYGYVAYLFATLAGISKVGSYTGNGGTQTIACGFTTGARFILIKRTDNTGDWFVWDTVRGIVAGNDPHLSLNTTVAEVTTDDSIDPDTSGFIVNQLAATNINVNAATYIFLAFA